MNRKSLLVSCALFAVAGWARGEEVKKPWKNETEVSYVSSNGNSKTSTVAGKDTFTYTKSKTSLELSGGGLSSSDRGTQTAEKYFALEKVSYKLSDRNYAFERVGWDKDRFAGVANRWDGTLGLGRELIKTANDLLITELGGGRVSEERIDQPTNKFTSGRAYAKYTRTLSDTSKFSQDVEYLHNFDDPDDFRVNTESALIAALSSHFSLKASYLWKYVGQPPVGFGRSDTQTNIALIAVY